MFLVKAVKVSVFLLSFFFFTECNFSSSPSAVDHVDVWSGDEDGSKFSGGFISEGTGGK